MVIVFSRLTSSYVRSVIVGSSMKVVSSESSSKTTFQRSSKGPVSFADVNADGKSITLENTSKLKVTEIIPHLSSSKQKQSAKVLRKN